VLGLCARDLDKRRTISINCGDGRKTVAAASRMDIMSADTVTTSKQIAEKWGLAGFVPEMPKFAMPNFDMPKMEVPAAFRDFAEKGVAQAKDNYEKMKTAAEEATDVLENTYAKASKGMSDYGLKVIEVARVNSNANFDYFASLFGVKSLAEVVELSTAHARKQFETLTAQSKELTSFAQQVAVDTTEPIKGSVSKVFSKAA
jgi:phasin